MSKRTHASVEILMAYFSTFLASHGEIKSSEAYALARDRLIPKRFVMQAIRRLGLSRTREWDTVDQVRVTGWNAPNLRRPCHQ